MYRRHLVAAVFLGSLISAFAGAAVPLPPNQCDHPLFPMRPGANWTYGATAVSPENGYFLDVAQILPLGLDRSFAFGSLALELSEQSFPVGFECDAGGIALVDLPDLVLPLPAGGFLSLALVEQSGYILPTFAAFQEEDPTWTMLMDLDVVWTTSGGRSFPLKFRIVMNSAFLGISEEPVSVPAGDFDNAYQIEQVITLAAGLPWSETLREFTFVRLWYLAEGVGPIRAVLRGVDSDLEEFFIPETPE